jgi:iron complex transport system ATP-binding protein
MTGGLLTISGVRVRGGGRTILEIDALEIPAGAFVGILGPNGAGKTTLLKVCTGLVRPAAGSVCLEGLDLARLSGWRRCGLRRRIGYIPQVAHYNAELPFTVREVVAMGRTSVRSLLRPLKARDREIADHWIDAVGLADRRGQTFRSLSGGEQQKVLIARAMAQEPQILMLDEACANLDFLWKREISDMVERLYEGTGLTILMVSHETDVLPGACRRAVVLAAGQVLADGPVGDVLSSEILNLAYRGDLTTVTVGGRTHIVKRPVSLAPPSSSPPGIDGASPTLLRGSGSGFSGAT